MRLGFAALTVASNWPVSANGSTRTWLRRTVSGAALRRQKTTYERDRQSPLATFTVAAGVPGRTTQLRVRASALSP